MFAYRRAIGDYTFSDVLRFNICGTFHRERLSPCFWILIGVFGDQMVDIDAEI